MALELKCPKYFRIETMSCSPRHSSSKEPSVLADSKEESSSSSTPSSESSATSSASSTSSQSEDSTPSVPISSADPIQSLSFKFSFVDPG
ncbi:hypothetical protein L2E82_43946 [Cichorium intybus]|uniref:Uncharacterized protein n=1 Tax=Cichorium intybus TaxID=13427 RepID=A0ACB8ZQF9_CICIN|nr:hypothetical protein L2E82_43946 [Cichorium intybus]